MTCGPCQVATRLSEAARRRYGCRAETQSILLPAAAMTSGVGPVLRVASRVCDVPSTLPSRALALDEAVRTRLGAWGTRLGARGAG